MNDELLNKKIKERLGGIWSRDYEPMTMVHMLEQGEKLSSIDSLIAQGIQLISRQILAEEYE